MSLVYTYISTKSTVDPYIPKGTTNLATFSRDVSDGFMALSGGRFVVGQLAQFPVQRSVPNHLLCDGRQVSKASFPELFDLIGDTQGTSTDANFFVLPNYVGAGSIAPATTTATETTSGGTVSTTDPTPSPTPEAFPTHGDVDSGGRPRDIGNTVLE